MNDDPTVEEIEEGDVELLITDDQAHGDYPYIMEVLDEDGDGSPVRISHNKAYAEEGTTLSAGQSHTLSNLRGERLYVSAFDGDAQVRVRPAAANVESQPPKDVTVLEGDVQIQDGLDVSDRAGREVGVVSIEETVDVDVDEPVTTDGTVTVDGAVQLDEPIEIEGLEGAEVTVDEVTIADSDPISDETTSDGSASAAQLELGPRRSTDVYYDVSAETDVVVEFSTDGEDWLERERTTVDGDGMILVDVGFAHVRAWGESNVNQIVIGAKGA